MGLVDSYNTGDDGVAGIGSVIWVGQSFTTSKAYDISSVKLLLYKNGTPGTVTVSIMATAAGLPTGADLCSGTINGNDLTTDTAGEWKEILFGSPASLSTTTLYAIVVRAAGAYGSLYWRQKVPGDYGDGGGLTSTDSGSSWSSALLYDKMFETYEDTTSVLTLSGVVNGASSVTGNIGANPVSVLSLAGVSNGASSITGDISSIAVTVSTLSGLSAGASSITGALSLISVLQLSGTVAGVSSITGDMVSPVVVSGLSGTVSGVSAVSGDVSWIGSSSESVLLDTTANFNSDMVGAICYMTSGDNAGEYREIGGVSEYVLNFSTPFDYAIQDGDTYCISPVKFGARCWPLQMKDNSKFQRWIMEGVCLKVKDSTGFMRKGSSVPISNNKWRVGAYRNSESGIESSVVYIDVSDDPSSSAGALGIDGVDIEPYIEQISAGTKFELIDGEVLVTESDSREVAD